ncbi:hypothetical protein ACVRZR_05865 [Streptococcus entericus]|uniref:hypothetical protein n=1 Tax=Streptococcus entericus TaxID=155680 RepID=UPI00039AFCDC|nr:hypothetical protein [Streptococcus entericus]
MAVQISFAETAEELDRVKAQFAKLTTSATPAQTQPAQGTKQPCHKQVRLVPLP